MHFKVMKMDYYYNKRGEPIPMMDWAKLFENKKYKIIEQTILPNKRWVSTVWLGLNQNLNYGSKPIIFETIVFSKEFRTIKRPAKELAILRYSTLKKAKEGHKEMCKKWMKKKKE